MAVAVSPAGDRSMPRVILNPSGREQHATVIDADMKGFFICQSEDEAKLVAYYCDTCHGNGRNSSKITRCSCHEKSKKLLEDII